MHAGQKQAGFLQLEYSYNAKLIEDALGIRISQLHIFSKSMHPFKKFLRNIRISISPVHY